MDVNFFEDDDLETKHYYFHRKAVNAAQDILDDIEEKK